MKPTYYFLLVFLTGILLLGCTPQEAKIVSDSRSLPRATPESQGISSEGLIQFLDAIESSGTEFHSLMILRHGQVVSEGWWSPFEKDYLHQLYSLSKSFTSTAVGLAAQEGLLSLDDKVIKFFPDKMPNTYDPKLDQMTLRHLITMSTGHMGNTMDSLRQGESEDWQAAFMTLAVGNEPGSVFKYNTAATYMLSSIVQKVSGNTVEDFLKPRLLEPLGIDKSDWMTDPHGVNVGGYGFRVNTEGIAKLGQLYLQKGNWKGQQLLNEEWCIDATSKQVASSASDGNFDGNNDWSQGYGYQFWRNTVGGFRADGAYGQFSIVLPEHDVVIAITSQSMDMGNTMKLVWTNLLPAIASGTLPENPEKGNELRERLENLVIKPETFEKSSSIASMISGKTYEMESNDSGLTSVSFEIDRDIYTVSLEMENGENIKVNHGIHSWATKGNPRKNWNQVFPIPGRLANDSEIAGLVTWENDNTLRAYWQFYETCHGDQLTFRFDDDRIEIEFLNSLAKGGKVKETRASIWGSLQ